MSENHGREDGVPEMRPAELKARMDREQPLVVVDVREPHEREIADLPDYGQRTIPVGELEGRIGELDLEAPTVLYCRSGGRSRWAAERLLERGFQQVWNLKGGILGWKEEVDPTLREY